MTPERLARVCHEANRAYCMAAGLPVWQPAWDLLSADDRFTVIAGVKFILANPKATPEESHESWRAAKDAFGWRYGPEKDEEKRLHPCMCSYDMLPEEQRRKDALFGAVVRALM